MQDDTFAAVWAASDQAAFACTNFGVFYRSNGNGSWSEGQVLDPSLDRVVPVVMAAGAVASRGMVEVDAGAARVRVEVGANVAYVVALVNALRSSC